MLKEVETPVENYCSLFISYTQNYIEEHKNDYSPGAVSIRNFLERLRTSEFDECDNPFLILVNVDYVSQDPTDNSSERINGVFCITSGRIQKPMDFIFAFPDGSEFLGFIPDDSPLSLEIKRKIIDGDNKFNVSVPIYPYSTDPATNNTGRIVWSVQNIRGLL